MPGFDYDSTTTFTPQFLGSSRRSGRCASWTGSRPTTVPSRTSPTARARPATVSRRTASSTSSSRSWSTRRARTAGSPSPRPSPIRSSPSSPASRPRTSDMTAHQCRAYESGFPAAVPGHRREQQRVVERQPTAYQTFLTAANANATRYTGTYAGGYGPSWMSSNTDLMKVGQYHADRLGEDRQRLQVGFRRRLRASSRSVLSGWALGTVYSDVGLTFIQANYGDPKKYVTYVAQAPYFDLPMEERPERRGPRHPVHRARNRHHRHGRDVSGLRQARRAVRDRHRRLRGSPVADGNDEPDVQAPRAARRPHVQHLQELPHLWKQDFGPSLFMHFSLAGNPGTPETIYQYGFGARSSGSWKTRRRASRICPC